MIQRLTSHTPRPGTSRAIVFGGLVLLTVALSACERRPPPPWHPEHVPVPSVPPENALTPQKVELGRHLFYDERLSVNGETSCGTCHVQRLAFTDGRPRAIGATGEVHTRNAMSLANVAYSSRLTWSHPHLNSLEEQARMALFSERPTEMGLGGHDTEMLARLRSDPETVTRFREAFPDDDDPVQIRRILDAIASFERMLISGDAPYDRYVQGDETALTPGAIRGMDLFFSERLACFHCHGGFNFSDSVDHDRTPRTGLGFHNTGLYNVDGRGGYPAEDTGLHRITAKPDHMGQFKAPTLRNVAVTSPYMHDGSITTLEEVIDHYSGGGRTLTTGPNAGRGSDSPLRSEFIVGFVLTKEEKADLLDFLESLTDVRFLSDRRFSAPRP